uniref:Uncharacterized protein n=1 Tax=Trichobilharzia regenti TaxID=157069 RepID=A0AA85J5Y1_TRIRE|nr:unnamed protein product [Trichobilharzia regenti]
MICLWNYVNSVLRTPVTPDAIWKKLKTLYNMEELHDSEVDSFQVSRVNHGSDTATLKSSVLDTSNQKRTRKSVRWADILVTSYDLVQTPTTSAVTTDAGVGSSSRKRRR